MIRYHNGVRKSKARLGADCGSDHNPVIAQLHIKLQKNDETKAGKHLTGIHICVDVSNTFSKKLQAMSKLALEQPVAIVTKIFTFVQKWL